MSEIKDLAAKIIAGYRVKRGDDLSVFVDSPLKEIRTGARAIQTHFCGKHVDLCTIINGRSGRCGEDCKYCAQSARHKTGIEEYPFLPAEKIVKHAKANQNAGVNRFAIVTYGRSLTGEEFEQALATYKEMHEKLTIDLCASHGILNAEQFKRLREVGVTSYHHNIETSRRFFPQICTTHTYEDRINTIRLAQAAGLSVCSGVIIGMGENWEDRLDMALSLSELKIESIPINALMPVKGTPLEGQARIPGEDILRTVAFFRYINPTANIRLAAGRKLLPQNGVPAFKGGASATITGDMLTTSGTTIAEDIKLLRKLGFSNKN